MVKLLLKVRVQIVRMFTPILRLVFIPFNNDVRLFVKSFLDHLTKRDKTFLLSSF